MAEARTGGSQSIQVVVSFISILLVAVCFWLLYDERGCRPPGAHCIGRAAAHPRACGDVNGSPVAVSEGGQKGCGKLLVHRARSIM